MGRARIRSRSLRRRRGHDQREKNGWKSLVAHRRAGHWKDGVGVRHCARVRDESTVLPDGWVGGVLARSEEDGGVDGAGTGKLFLDVVFDQIREAKLELEILEVGETGEIVNALSGDELD